MSVLLRVGCMPRWALSRAASGTPIAAGGVGVILALRGARVVTKKSRFRQSFPNRPVTTHRDDSYGNGAFNLSFTDS